MFICLLALTPAAARADVPASVEASRVQQRLNPPPPLPRAPRVIWPAPDKPAAAGKTASFILTGVTVDGMTVYRDAAMAPLYAARLGTRVTRDDLSAIAGAMTEKYHGDGYVLSKVTVPPQDGRGGVLRLRAVEGYIDRIEVRGAGDTARITSILNAVRMARPLNASALTRALRLINAGPDMSAEAAFGPGSGTDGGQTLILTVTRRVVDGSLSLDNRGSRYLGPVQALAGVTLNNLFGRLESLGVQVALAPDSRMRRTLGSAGVTGSVPLDGRGTRLSLNGAITETRPGFVLASIDNVGVARSFGARVLRPVLRSASGDLALTAQFDWLDSRRDDNLSATPTIDRLRVLRVGAIGHFADAWDGANTAELTFSQGIGLFNASKRGALGLTRANGDPQFFKTTLNVTRVQPFGDAWEGMGAASAQKSARLLLASEEFGLGGAQFGSAYDASELTGEDGVAFRAELRRNLSIAPPVQGVQVYGFYDIGKVWNRDDAVPDHRQASLADAGMGARLAISDRADASLEIARPLTRPVSTTGTKDTRAFFALTARF